MDKEEIRNRIAKGWIHARFTIEVMANTAENAEKSLKNHMEKIRKQKNIILIDEKIDKPEKVENPPRPLTEAYSQVIESEMLISKYEYLVNFVFVFGPSSLEILAPEKIELSQEEMQNILNNLATIIHQFAAAGVGGLIISPA